MQFGKPQAHAADPPSLAPEDSWPCGHRVAIRDINRAHDLMTQLQAVLLQFPVGSTWSQLGGDIIKDILKLTASYFRCTYKEEQGCEAKKTVQQEDGHADPPKFTVEYTARHTCKLSESTTGLPFQKPSWPPPTSDRLITSSSSSSSPSLVAATTDAKVDGQSRENVFFNGDLDLLRVHDEMLDDWDWELDDLLGRASSLELDMLFGDE
ncbi:hypothetical protein ZIOFF_027373 [Zingiber officinale]|uniref:WRKY domain-containing protein n=1 Tax=Zingiber officinale TaxID=94328 RepID=A0A8J5GT61_ZINOF|nr:hypothetical protein ZIOFF_027373 [Zingiber officinale]